MRRSSLAAAAALVLAAGALPPGASASELGQTSTPVSAPVCPSGTSANTCDILLTQMTGLETLSDGAAYPTRVRQAGMLTAMTLGISSAAKGYVASLDKLYGGGPSAEITVLRPVRSDGAFRWQVAAQSAPQSLAAYQGAVVLFPLAQAIPVVAGEVVAVSTTTWAPVLSIELSKTGFAYRQPVVATPQSPGAAATCWQRKLGTPLSIGVQNTYGCDYTGTRVEYTASEVLTPTPTAAIRFARRYDARRNLRPRIIRR